jgi:hypothetical protein
VRSSRKTPRFRFHRTYWRDSAGPVADLLDGTVVAAQQVDEKRRVQKHDSGPTHLVGDGFEVLLAAGASLLDRLPHRVGLFAVEGAREFHERALASEPEDDVGERLVLALVCGEALVGVLGEPDALGRMHTVVCGLGRVLSGDYPSPLSVHRSFVGRCIPDVRFSCRTIRIRCT